MKDSKKLLRLERTIRLDVPMFKNPNKGQHDYIYDPCKVGFDIINKTYKFYKDYNGHMKEVYGSDLAINHDKLGDAIAEAMGLTRERFNAFKWELGEPVDLVKETTLDVPDYFAKQLNKGQKQ